MPPASVDTPKPVLGVGAFKNGLALRVTTHVTNEIDEVGSVMQVAAAGGADGARTRDLRRDRPPLDDASSGKKRR